MTYSYFSRDSSPSPFRVAALLVLAAAIVGVLGGCDTNDPRPENAADSSLDAPDVNVERASVEQIDLQYEPVSLAPGETFSIELTDNQHDRPVTRILHEGTSNGKMSVKAKFAPLQPSSVAVLCRNEMTGTEQTMTTLTSAEFDLGGTLQPVAMTDDEPDSYHYSDNGETVIVSVDYDEESTSASAPTGPSFDFPSSEQPVQCTHVSFALSGVSAPLSPSGVQFGGDVEAPAIQSKEAQ